MFKDQLEKYRQSEEEAAEEAQSQKEKVMYVHMYFVVVVVNIEALFAIWYKHLFKLVVPHNTAVLP